MGGKTVRHLVKNSSSVRLCYRFNLSRSPHASLKEYKNRLSNITFRFFCLQAPEAELFGLIKLKLSYLKLSHGELLVRPLQSMDVFLGLDFLLLEVHQ